MIGTALAIFSLASSAAAMAGSAIKNRKNEQELQQRRKELDMEYKYDYNMDFLNTPMAKSAISLLSQKYIENARKVAQGSVIAGKSAESTTAATEAMQKPYVNSISQLTGYGQERQDSVRRNWLMSDQHLADLQYMGHQQQAQNWSNFAGNAANAGMGFAAADSAGGFNKWDQNIANRKSLRDLAKQSWKGNLGGETKLAPSLFHN